MDFAPFSMHPASFIPPDCPTPPPTTHTVPHILIPATLLICLLVHQKPVPFSPGSVLYMYLHVSDFLKIRQAVEDSYHKTLMFSFIVTGTDGNTSSLVFLPQYLNTYILKLPCLSLKFSNVH
jgi:hypothetical protein